ncbi:hypothetical protein TSTA_000400 [Talaromyces stipitatus ATCC 10500]|uniref:PiggyBac transposable element-derived protein domain-containing protein n=1 Tax=Talaromyces stipitatus (strain ATCC 10500 / CBS 375.48 / QM 6759 / NRRL 1006) TaxID=441959 RepID=B8MSB0_TALSN|nr:uncharacterized protein TSTA_000400 [Talaromyces stipitatus ATCC 10500]EED11963.1 hypothetical protein TSTA_000400 [Talaromyces stipitatus ATCC 10500]
MTPSEIKIFLAILIYMGVHISPRDEDYWQTTEPLHIPRRFMGLQRFQQIKRFFHVADPRPEAAIQEAIRLIKPNQMSWYKLELFASRLRAACLQYWKPSNAVSIDETMANQAGHHKSLVKVKKHENLTLTRSTVVQLAQEGLSSQCNNYTIYMDNYFSAIPLFDHLRQLGIGACGTTRPNASKKLFPKALRVLKEPKKLQYDWVPRLRKRPAKSFTSAKNAREPFGDQLLRSFQYHGLLMTITIIWVMWIEQINYERAMKLMRDLCAHGGLYSFGPLMWLLSMPIALQN